MGIARQPCDLARLVIEVVRDSVPRALEKQIDLGYDGAEPGAPGVWMDGNPTLLKELVRNLVDNAINYTPSGPGKPGVVTAKVLADTFGHVLLLQVEDSGPGVPESERELVFQPFYRAPGQRGRRLGPGVAHRDGDRPPARRRGVAGRGPPGPASAGRAFHGAVLRRAQPEAETPPV